MDTLYDDDDALMMMICLCLSGFVLCNCFMIYIHIPPLDCTPIDHRVGGFSLSYHRTTLLFIVESPIPFWQGRGRTFGTLFSSLGLGSGGLGSVGQFCYHSYHFIHPLIASQFVSHQYKYKYEYNH